MDLLSEMRTAVQADLSTSSSGTFFTTTVIDLAINRAYIKAAGLFRWPETEDAKKTNSVATQEYYDYPDTWRPDSVWKLTVDDVDYGSPLAFKDYLYEKENNIPSGRDYLWASQWRRYFIYPTPTTNGSYNIVVWGQMAVESLVNDTDYTIFSYSMPECNEAIVLEATAMLKTKAGDMKTKDMMSVEAKQILIVAWGKVRQEQAKYNKTLPFFDVPDYYANENSVEDNIGNF
jgi:hypothetical protein